MRDLLLNYVSVVGIECVISIVSSLVSWLVQWLARSTAFQIGESTNDTPEPLELFKAKKEIDR